MKKQMILPLIVATAWLVSCAQTPAKEPTALTPGAKLSKVIHDYTETTEHLDPFYAPYFNLEQDLAHFGDYPSPNYFVNVKESYRKALADLENVDFNQLSESEQRTYLLFKEDMAVNLKEFDFPGQYLQFTQMGNRLHDYMDSSNQSLTSFPFDSIKHYDDYLKRADEFPRYIDLQIAQLREGLRQNVVQSCVISEKIPHTYQEALEPDAQKNPFFRPILFMPKTIGDRDRRRLSESFEQVIRTKILPGYQKFDQFFTSEYAPKCRQGFGLGSFPQGKSWYAQEIKVSTSLTLDPEDIHRTGLREVARISAELEKIKRQRKFKGSLREFMVRESKDPKSFFKSSADLFAAFAKVKVEVAQKLPTYFGELPKSDFKIVETSNPEDPAGSYNQPTELMPYGRFLANTKNLRAVPISGVTTLMLHETAPGHHLQLALQFEKKDELSEYQRKLYSSNAFAEGWALYSEYLGNEMGLFKDPAQRFGNLNDEMLRAVRLVVDTGIHAKGWSQKKAIAYARAHLASDDKDIETEINRYSVWPGQALGYKIGQLKILELRHLAEKQLGPKFDLRGFHQAVIGHGTVSLGVLEMQVNDWIKKTALVSAH